MRLQGPGAFRRRGLRRGDVPAAACRCRQLVETRRCSQNRWLLERSSEEHGDTHSRGGIPRRCRTNAPSRRVHQIDPDIESTGPTVQRPHQSDQRRCRQPVGLRRRPRRRHHERHETTRTLVVAQIRTSRRNMSHPVERALPVRRCRCTSIRRRAFPFPAQLTGRRRSIRRPRNAQSARQGTRLHHPARRYPGRNGTSPSARRRQTLRGRMEDLASLAVHR